MVHYGDTIRLMHKSTGHFLGVVEAEAQLTLSYDQIYDERQHQVCLLPNTFHPEKAKKLHWIVSWDNCHNGLPVCFFPSQKAGVILTNSATKLKLHSHEIPVFGEDGFEVTAFHVAHDPNNAWAISGIRADDPFLCSQLLSDNLPYVGHPHVATDQSILDEDLAFETARKTCLMDFYDVHIPSGYSSVSS